MWKNLQIASMFCGWVLLLKSNVLLQVFLEVLPKMQPELFEECGESSGYEKVSGENMFIFVLIDC